MSAINISKSLVLGEVTLERFAATAMPGALASIAKTIATTFAAFRKAAAKVDAVVVTRTSAQAIASAAHKRVVTSVDALVGAIVQSDSSKRLDPLAGFGKHTASGLLKGSRGAVAKRVGVVAKNVAASKSTKGVKTAAAACATAARTLARTHKKLIPQNVAFKEACEVRDTALADFSAAYETARLVGKRIWKAKPSQFEAVFGPLEPTFYSPKRRPKAQGDDAAAATATATKQAKKTAKVAASDATATAATTETTANAAVEAPPETQSAATATHATPA